MKYGVYPKSIVVFCGVSGGIILDTVNAPPTLGFIVTVKL